MAVMSFSSTEQVLAVLEAGPPTLETDARQQLSAQRSEQQLFATSPALGQLSAQRSETFAERAATPVCNTVALEQPSAQRSEQQLFAERTATSAALEQLLSVQRSEPEFYAEYAAAYKEEAPSTVQGGTLKTRYKGWLFKCHAVTSL